MPRKMSPTVDSASAPEMCMVRVSARASSDTIRCMIPRWYITAIRLATKTMIGRTLTASRKPTATV